MKANHQPRSILTVCIFLIINLSVTCQIYLSEGFESGSIPEGWTQATVIGNIPWRFENGGYSPPPFIDRFPSSAHSGSYNALFQEEVQGPTTKLITKSIDLGSAKKPELTFWHAQDQWGGETEIDELRVYYRSNLSDPWILLEEYTSHTPNWVQRSIFLPDSTLSFTYYLAFEGKSNWGFGTCVDDIQIIERGVIPMQAKEITVTQASTNILPTTSLDNPLLKIKVDVYGNYGKLLFDSVAIRSLCDSNSDIKSAGIKIYYTTDDVFSANEIIDPPKSLSTEFINFNQLDYELPFGTSYIWITADIDTFAVQNNNVDISIPAQGISLKLDTSDMIFTEYIYPVGDKIYYVIDGTTYDAQINYRVNETETSPAGERSIQQSIFYDNFESLKGWMLNGDFQIDYPNGFGGTEGGGPDPEFAYSGDKVFGNDLSGIGTILGDYENSSNSVFYAESPVFNCHYFKDIKLSYFRWLNVEAFDHSIVSISVDNGSTWTDLFYSSSNISERSWNFNDFDLSESNTDRQPEVKIRFGLMTDPSDRRSGWNIDNFAITGNYISSDVGITEIISPVSGCAHSTQDSITVTIRNYAGDPSSGVIPVKYSLNGGTTFLHDTIYSTIPVEGSITVTLDNRVDLSGAGIFDFIISTDVADDEDTTNNAVSKTLYLQPTYIPSHYENFESNGGIWMIDGNSNSTWECAYPSNPVLTHSGNFAWVTGPNGDYNTNDSSFVESVCYNFTGSSRYLLEFNYWLQTESQADGANIQYSVDNGLTWSILDTNDFSWNWNWYTDTVTSLHAHGWYGNKSTWNKSYQLMPQSFSSVPWVKFRVLFASDTVNTSRGIAFDDFNIYPAPPDVGIISIDMPESGCLYVNPDHITVSVKNFGLNKILTNDTIPVGYEFDGNTPVYNDFILSADLEPGDTAQYTFTDIIEMPEAREYEITAFSLLEDDPWFYFTNNDTTEKTITILPLPVTGLYDTIQSKEPDTVVIRAYYNTGYAYQWDYKGSIISTADTIKVPGPGVYHLLVTDTAGNGCSIYDSTYVELLYYDVGVSELLSPENSCALTSNEFIQIDIHNFGTDSIESGSKIALWYEVNGGAAIGDTLTLTTSLQAYHSIPFTFENDSYDFSDTGEYALKIYSYFGGDTIRTNDTIQRTFEVYGYPEIDLGRDTTVIALNYPLDAGPGFVSYEWQNGDTLQTFLVTESGTYHATITDSNSCSSSDTIYIRLKIRDIYPVVLRNPVSACQMTNPFNTGIQVKNNGTDTILAGEKIYMRYKINDDAYQIDSVELTSEFIPGELRNLTFTTQENFTAYGDYRFIVTATVTQDLLIANDTLYDTIYYYARPLVNFGLPDLYLSEEEEVILDGGEGASYTYLWQNNSTDRTFTAISDGFYRVKTTDSRTACFGKDSVTIVFIYKDVGITAVDLPALMCEGPQEEVEVEITNGATSLPVGTEIQIVHMVNGEITGQESRILTQTLSFGAKLSHVLSAAIPVPGTVPFTVKVYTIMEDDRDASNDTLTTVFETVKQSPDVDFGAINDTLTTSFPHILDAGSGQSSYEWSNGSTLQTLTVNSPGTYSVTVTGVNGCQTFKNVTLNRFSGLEDEEGTDLAVSLYPNPAVDYFYITLDATQLDDLVIEIYNSNGRRIHQTIEKGRKIISEEFNLNDYPNGLYFIKIYNKDVSYTGKIIVSD